jgi:hypothetical protein
MKREIIKTEALIGGTFNQKIEKITFLEGDKSKVIVRKESDYFNNDLIKEITFLNSLDKNLKKHFPEVLAFQIDKLPIFYEMPFYNLPTLRDAISEGMVDARLAMEILRKILVFMFEEVFSKNLGERNSDYLSKTTFNRIESRYTELKKESSLIKRFLEAKRIVISGVEYKNVSELLEILKKNKGVQQILTPKKTHLMHGDFHFDNFLVDTKNLDNFILLDPRGEHEGYAYDYDLGKLWFSFHGKYDLLTLDLFDLKYSIGESNSTIEVTSFEYKDSKIFRVLKDLERNKQELLELCKKYLKEPNLEFQILFNEAIHFCALAPFQIKKDGIERVAIAKYLLGVKLLNELFDLMGIK